MIRAHRHACNVRSAGSIDVRLVRRVDAPHFSIILKNRTARHAVLRRLRQRAVKRCRVRKFDFKNTSTKPTQALGWVLQQQNPLPYKLYRWRDATPFASRTSKNASQLVPSVYSLLFVVRRELKLLSLLFYLLQLAVGHIGNGEQMYNFALDNCSQQQKRIALNVFCRRGRRRWLLQTKIRFVPATVSNDS
jgi:hypothetical protein